MKIITPKKHETYTFIWTGKEKSIDLTIGLIHPNTSFELYGLLLGKAEKACDINIKVVHRAVNTRSKIVLRGVLLDRSKVRFNGLTTIEQGAKQTDAWLECRYLLLSNQAEGQAIPGLEILENDVKAGHAATAGKINDIQMFYLQSRGLSKERAKKLIVDGFIQDIAKRIPQADWHVRRFQYGY